ncbi:MAG: AAA family ATPase [Actinobacteria bacterium]|nr:AAA family ATPase [Actinomycetota bacterium]
MVRTSCPEKDTTCLHPETEEALRTWLRERKTPAFLLIGNPGVGKTTLVYRVCKEEKYWVQEFNASHTRTGSSFRDVIYPLLTNVGVSQWIQPQLSSGRAIVLDEMDGLSQGERGGLQELVEYLKSKKNFKEDRPLILICNVMDGKLMQYLMKFCCVQFMSLPKKEYLIKWFGKDLPDEIYNTGDIRKFIQYFNNNSKIPYQNTIINYPTEIPGDIIGADVKMNPAEDGNPIHIAIQAAWYSLRDKWIDNEELDLETKDANLAGLLYHQNIPAYFGEQRNNNDYYNLILNLIYLSDRADFWAFFHQCWNLLPHSYEMKLKIPNQYLSRIKPLGKTIHKIEDLQYTQVLTKQSALFNAWKELNKQCEKNHLPFRMTTQWANLQNDKKIIETIGLPYIIPKFESRPQVKKSKKNGNSM